MQEIINIHPKLNRSRYTLAILGGLIGGIFFGDILKLNLEFLGILGTIIIIGGYFYRKNINLILILIAILSFFVGVSYYRFYDFREHQKKISYEEQTIIARVDERPSFSGTTQQIILNYQTQGTKTKLLLQTGIYPQYKYGNILKIVGKIDNPLNSRPSTNFDYGNYLLKQGIRGIIKNPQKIEIIDHEPNIITEKIYNLGDKFNQAIQKVLPEPLAAFQIGLLFGNKTNIPDSLMSAFNRTGTTHIVAVSGYNITIIITIISLILARYSRKWAFLGTIITIIFIIILTGAGASVMRAGILAGLAAFARILGRRVFMPILILFVALILALPDPYILKNNISFQLSFLAFIGLVSLSPKIEQIKFIKNWPEIIKTAFSETMGAQILVLPILIYNFGTLSLIAPIANVLILTVIPAAMGLGFITGFAAMIWETLGSIISFPGYLLLKYILIVVEKLSAVSWAAITINTNQWWWIPVYYVIIIILMQNLNIKKQNEKSKI